MLKKSRATVAALCGVAALALVVIASGVTYAATATVPATITACVHHSGGGLYKAATCAAHDSSLTWNVKGPAGPRGPAGPAGLSLFVRVDENGKIYEHSAGVTVTVPQTGPFEVYFPQNVSKCVAVANQGMGSRGGFTSGGVTYLTEVVGSANVHMVNVWPLLPNGTQVAAGFNLILAC
jgi:hypothetical protein